MPATTPAQLLDSLNWRYATKVFDPARSIPSAVWAAVEQSLVLTPSSYGLQPWKFLVITDRPLREKLRAVSWNQGQVVDASHHVVFLARTGQTVTDVQKLIDATAQARGIPAAALDGYKGMMLASVTNGYFSKEWAARQCYIALGQLMASCAMLGLDACPMEGLDVAKYDEILGLTGTGYATAVACPVGYRATGDKYASLAKVRYPLDQVIERR